MNDTSIYVIVFESTHFAIAAEKRLKELNFTFEIIPTPREITASCGLSIRFLFHQLEAIKGQLEESKIGIKGIFEIVRAGGGKEVRQIG